MGNVIEFPSSRIVRPLKKRIARPRKAKPTDPLVQIEPKQPAARMAELLVERAVRHGRSLEQIVASVYSAKPNQDPLHFKIDEAVKAELRMRLGPCVVPLRPGRSPADLRWPTGVLGEESEKLARMAFERNLARGKPDTMEQARGRVLDGLDEISWAFRATKLVSKAQAPEDKGQ